MHLFWPVDLIMVSSFKTQFASLGFLRQGLICLAFVTMLLPTVEWLTIKFAGEQTEHALLTLSAGLIAPVMAPMLMVVLLLDIIMSKVLVADDPEGSGQLYRIVGRTQIIVLLVMLVFWVPFYISMTS